MISPPRGSTNGAQLRTVLTGGAAQLIRDPFPRSPPRKFSLASTWLGLVGPERGGHPVLSRAWFPILLWWGESRGETGKGPLGVSSLFYLLE